MRRLRFLPQSCRQQPNVVVLSPQRELELALVLAHIVRAVVPCHRIEPEVGTIGLRVDGQEPMRGSEETAKSIRQQPVAQIGHDHYIVAVELRFEDGLDLPFGVL